MQSRGNRLHGLLTMLAVSKQLSQTEQSTNPPWYLRDDRRFETMIPVCLTRPCLTTESDTTKLMHY